MRILRRGGPEELPVAKNVSVAAQHIHGDVVRAVQAGKDKPVYRNEILEKLSAAAREALSAQGDGTSDPAQ
jgi:sRNA-binding carbon storage regulator CsrA